MSDKRSGLLISDVLQELREENNRLTNELCFEKNINNVLENIRFYSLVLRNNCKCDQNIDIFNKLNQLEIDYKNVKNCGNNELNENTNNSVIDSNVSGIRIKSEINTNNNDLTENTTDLSVESNNNKSQQNSDSFVISNQKSLIAINTQNRNQNTTQSSVGTSVDSNTGTNSDDRRCPPSVSVKKKFFCSICNKIFDCFDVFSEHNKIHTSVQQKSEKRTEIYNNLRSGNKKTNLYSVVTNKRQKNIISIGSFQTLFDEKLKTTTNPKTNPLTTNETKSQTNQNNNKVFIQLNTTNPVLVNQNPVMSQSVTKIEEKVESNTDLVNKTVVPKAGQTSVTTGANTPVVRRNTTEGLLGISIDKQKIQTIRECRICDLLFANSEELELHNNSVHKQTAEQNPMVLTQKPKQTLFKLIVLKKNESNVSKSVKTVAPKKAPKEEKKKRTQRAKAMKVVNSRSAKYGYSCRNQYHSNKHINKFQSKELCNKSRKKFLFPKNSQQLEEKRFNCDLCDFETTDKRTLTVHKIRHEEYWLKCNQTKCEERFASEEEYFSHLYCVHKKTIDESLMRTTTTEQTIDENETKINKTFQRFVNKRPNVEKKAVHSLPVRLHELLVKQKERKRFTTTKYGIKLMDEKDVKQNMNCFYYKCVKCLKFCETRIRLLDHLKDSHNETVFACDLCDYQSYNKRTFEAHLLSHEEYRFKCQEYGCRESFANELDLDLHLNRDHKFTFGCNECNEVFLSERLIVTHLSKVHKIPAYACDLCTYTTCIRGYLLQHLTTHFKCGFKGCDKAFDSSENLAQHKLSHFEKWMSRKRSLKTVQKILCDDCGKHFKSKQQFLTHWSQTHKKSILECNSCEYKTHKKFDLIRHKTIHSIVRPFKCDFDDCDQQFRYRHLLKTHKRHIHSNTIYLNQPLTCVWPQCGICLKTKKTLRSQNTYWRQAMGLCQ